MTVAVSPKYTAAKLSSGAIEDLIDVYDDQVLGWLIGPAKQMTGNQHAGFALLSLALTYFEPIGQFLDGKVGRSEAQFTKGLKDVFPGLDPSTPPSVFGELYNQLRCGMFHRGLTKAKVLVTRGAASPIVLIHGPAGLVMSVTVDPWELLQAVGNHHAGFVARLRDPVETGLRTKFRSWFVARAA